MRYLLVVLVFLAALAGGTAVADPAPRKPTNVTALEHFTKGARLYGNAAFAEAIEAFKASALVEPSPATDFNLGVCYRLLGEASTEAPTKRVHYERAIWHYERFIKTSPQTPTLAADVKTLIDGMRT
jgi:tetratricopeptide (TPR) repeat protein